MTEADHPGTIDSEEYEYDANGNRINGSYDIDPNNQMRSDGVYTYEYDDEGNRTKRYKSGEYTEYTWDHRNRLVAVDTWDGALKTNKQRGVRYTYDAFDRRIAKEIDEDANGVFTDTVDWAEHFVYDGDHIALVFDEDGSLKSRYLHGPAIDQVLAEETFDSMGLSDEVYWQLADNLGSIRDVVTYDGIDTATVVKHLTYGAFGNITSDSNMSIDVRFAYTGREFDIETGLYYYRARYYDADNGRFISEDPIGFNAGDTNLCRYVGNRVTVSVDPSGKEVEIATPGTIDELMEEIARRIKEDYVKKCEEGLLKKNLTAEEINLRLEDIAKHAKQGLIATLHIKNGKELLKEIEELLDKDPLIPAVAAAIAAAGGFVVDKVEVPLPSPWIDLNDSVKCRGVLTITAR